MGTRHVVSRTGERESYALEGADGVICAHRSCKIKEKGTNAGHICRALQRKSYRVATTTRCDNLQAGRRYHCASSLLMLLFFNLLITIVATTLINTNQTLFSISGSFSSLTRKFAHISTPFPTLQILTSRGFGVL